MAAAQHLFADLIGLQEHQAECPSSAHFLCQLSENGPGRFA
jgi:hypothetical protein